MCGTDLRRQSGRIRRVSLNDAVLVAIVLLVIWFWWRTAGPPEPEVAARPEITFTLPVAAVDDRPPPTSTPTPEPATPDPLPTAPPLLKHRVRSGETLLAISGQYGVSVAEIQAANGLTSELIRAGDELNIPLKPGEAGAGTPSVASLFTYLVQPGDTVVSIATRFGTTVAAILSANNMARTDFIRPNQQLRVPVGELPAAVLQSGAVSTGDGSSGSAAQTPPVYAAPQLLGPVDRTVVRRDEAVLFRWLSVDILAPHEWYVLRIWSADGSVADPPAVWTKATSYRLQPQFAPQGAAAADFRWQVSVVRVLTDQTGGRELQAASRPSDIRAFTWR